MLTSNDTVVNAAAPPVSVYCAENVTVLPFPDDGVMDTAAGTWGGGAVTPRRASHPMLPPLFADWIGPASGRFSELVCPPRNILPFVSTATALATSDPLPPK